MTDTSKAEQLGLPEQLYVLLIDPDTGETPYPRQAVERVMATAIVWELLHSGAFDTTGNTITHVREALYAESYLRRAALVAAGRVPIDGRELIWEVAAQLHPISTTIGEDLVAKHLLTIEVQKRFAFFNRRVFMELTEARSDALALSAGMAQAARNLWDPNYDDELARTHPRLLARIVLLDNHHLLKPLIGSQAYNAAAPHVASIRAHLHQMVAAQTARPRTSGPSDSTSSCTDSSWYLYDSGSSFWIDSSDYSGGDSHGHGSHDGGHDGGHGDNSDSGSSSDGGGGGDGGGCGGCGGCGG